ncbi:response regulator [Virgibacillus sp. 6R]|uniref:response regulator transcription factor n=1 Tax=Metabacillus sp. 22489 TaxID=3453928 RepID=UPI0011A90CCF
MAYKVFLVDDDRFVRKGLINLIDWEGCGFEVCAEADNGEDALEYIQTNHPDLVITDIKMPVLDGLELIKQTVETKKSPPNFIIITGYSDFKYAQRAVKYSVDDFILKPVDKDEIEETLKKVAEKKKRKLQVDRNRNNILATTAFNELLTEELEEAHRHDCMKKLNINQTTGMAYMIIEINNIIVNVAKLRDIISKMLHGEHYHSSTLFRDHGNNRIGILVKSEEMEQFNGNIIHFSEALKKQLTNSLNTEVSLYIGKIINNPNDIKETYDTAIKALQFKYLESLESPIIYGKTKVSNVNYIELDQTIYQTLFEYIEENQPSQIKNAIDKMFEQFQDKAFAKDAVKTSINRVVHEVIKTIQTMEGDEKNLSFLQIMLNWENQPRTLQVIKGIFLDFILEAAALINQLNKESGTVHIRRIKKYVDMHYKEDITLKSIANQFFMNPVYMGQLFKKTYGMYFKDYLLQVRIKEAKKKLRQTDMRVYQVAEVVGFSNSDYFVTQFEKITGMTPTQYRKKILRKMDEMELP